jgi:small subunit ribosomal protein S20
MAHHQSAKKRIRQNEKKRIQNRYYAKTTRNAIKKLRSIEDKEEALKMYPQVSSMIDKLVKRHQFHRNKAANLKSKLMKHINKLGATVEN